MEYCTINNRTGAKIIINVIVIMYYYCILNGKNERLSVSTYNGSHIQRQFAKINCKVEKSLKLQEAMSEMNRSEVHTCVLSTRTHGKLTDHPTRMQRRRERKNESP